MRSLSSLLILSLAFGTPEAPAPKQEAVQKPVPAGQDQEDPAKPQDEDAIARDLFGRPAPDTGGLYEALQGAWQLVAIDDPLLEAPGRSLHGMLLVSGQFLAIELHVAWDDVDGTPLRDAFQTGFHEFAMDRHGTIQMLSVIGSFLDDDEELDWESPGTVREFRVTTDGAFLTLMRLDGSSLKFVRRHPRVGQTQDIFGRTEGSAPSGGRDVFGRPIEAPRPPPANADDKNDGGD